jgi:hypothetical protein
MKTETVVPLVDTIVDYSVFYTQPVNNLQPKRRLEWKLKEWPPPPR